MFPFPAYTAPRSPLDLGKRLAWGGFRAFQRCGGWPVYCGDRAANASCGVSTVTIRAARVACSLSRVTSAQP